MRVVMLTTKDNPFNPFDQFEEWKQFDEEKLYNTCSLLARVCKVSSEMSDFDYNKAIEEACDDIIRLRIGADYEKVVRVLDE